MNKYIKAVLCMVIVLLTTGVTFLGYLNWNQKQSPLNVVIVDADTLTFEDVQREYLFQQQCTNVCYEKGLFPQINLEVPSYKSNTCYCFKYDK